MKSNDIDLIKDAISEIEFEYYKLNDSKELKDSFIDFEFGVPNYDTLLKVIGINDSKTPKESEIKVDEIKRKMDKVDAFESTEYMNLYFIRMEQYALADEDAMIGRIIFTDNIKNAVQECINLLNKRNIVLEFKRLRKQEK